MCLFFHKPVSDCQDPKDIPNANKSTAAVFRVMDNVTYTCHPGFWVSRGNYTGKSMCQFGSIWTPPPTCVRK